MAGSISEPRAFEQRFDEGVISNDSKDLSAGAAQVTKRREDWQGPVCDRTF
jgi:hypothetical protein